MTNSADLLLLAGNAASSLARQPAGMVRLHQHTLTDDGGDFLSLGVTWMWAVEGYARRRAQFDANLEVVAKYGLAPRIFPYTEWPDLFLPFNATAFADTIDALWAAGLRSSVTFFPGVVQGDSRDRRSGIVNDCLAVMRERRERIGTVSIANEPVRNGFADLEAELVGYAERVEDAGFICSLGAAEEWKDHAPASRLFSYDTERSGIRWRDERAPYYWGNEIPGYQAYENIEPKGPRSSGASEDDPLKITAQAVMTWLNRGCSYVFHTGPGVKGIALPALNRPANFFDLPTWDACATALATMRALLPQDLPNWERHWHAKVNDSGVTAFPYRVDPGNYWDRAGARDERCYSAWHGKRFIAIPLGITEDGVQEPAHGPTHTRVYDLLTGELRSEHDGAFLLQASPRSCLLMGEVA